MANFNLMTLDENNNNKARGVRTTHTDYEAYLTRWQMCRDVMSGQYSVHKAGELYLPKLEEQALAEYEVYKKRAVFYNASWRTVHGFHGMLFRKPPELVVPKSIERLLEDVALSGMPFDRLVSETVYDVLQVGRLGLLVDHPVVQDVELTVAEAELQGMRPVIKMYTTETIINWKYRVISNVNMLSMVVLSEEHMEPISEFEEESEKRYRVLDLNDNGFYRVRLFRIDKNDKDEQVGKEMFPLMNGQPLRFIPFVFIGPDGTDAKCEDPPLIDLVYVNLSHYMLTADYEHGCHFTALPTPWVTGFGGSFDGANGSQTSELHVGSQRAWLLPDANARCGYMEFSGTGLAALRVNLDGKKQEMATLGARMLADASDTQVETFGATAIKHVAENSILAAIAISVSTGIEKALKWFADWAGASEEEIAFSINREFLPVGMDPATLGAILGAWQAGAISFADLFALLKRGEIISHEKTLEEHQGEIDIAPIATPVQEDLEKELENENKKMEN